ncbi:type I-F CRISPR-associated protein Csy1 [Azohydromonas caseinilytica]|uniref:Type I-F CRISPR-associated protein Csy1 n=1 Tax=Azohydromonas caseinilytica TaxID=2728836 RepID=A0A848F8U1_9BURK|nr:type I-F CRISPR-associated protein Csy1 [Azohydromonas caseinilytica]NML15974.1 type I-F CRISPR-associated protein Csy1 [Azohydromonas caseinilytica]
MPTPPSARQAELAALVSGWLTDRLNDKLEKLSPDDPKRAELRQQYEPGNWLPDAARRVAQLQAVTHSLKPLHPDAKGTSLHADPSTLPALDVVGSHCLGSRFDNDVVGNAAALDVNKFLNQRFEGRTLLMLSQARDPDWAAVLSDEPEAAASMMAAFAGLTEPRDGLASHTHAKQVYWLVGDDPCDDASYHLLAPLHPTSLIHRFYAQLQDDRFGEATKAAREAKRQGQFSEHPLHGYPNLAVRKLGGSKPWNISVLNNERRGENLLLASLPPVWNSEPVRPLHRVDDLFKVFGYREQVRRLVPRLRGFLETDSTANKDTRDRRAELVDALVDEFIQFTAELRGLPEGWSREAECRLGEAEKCWLDPLAAPADGLTPDEIMERIAEQFANWLNEQLRGKLLFGDPEFLAWRKRVLEEVKAYDWEVTDER